MPVSESAERELKELEHTWMEAVRGRDMEFLEELLADEFTLTTGRPGAEVRSRREWLEVTRDEYAIERFEFEEIRVQPHGDAAVVRSRYRQRARMGDQDRSTSYLMTDVFVRKGGRWRAIARHISPLGP
jgi:ketosteroid isomerase-like protein